MLNAIFSPMPGKAVSSDSFFSIRSIIILALLLITCKDENMKAYEALIAFSILHP